LTQGKPAVTDLVSCCALHEDELLAVAAAVESRSEHPLAKAVVAAAQARHLSLDAVQDFQAVTGKGIVSTVDGREVRLGSITYLIEKNPLPERLQEPVERCSPGIIPALPSTLGVCWVWMRSTLG